MAWQITICSRCDAAGHLRRCWRTRLRDAFAAQTVSVIVRGCRAASACVFQPRAGVAGFASDAARLSLANELCAARPPSLNARALSQQVLPGGLTYKVWQPHGDAWQPVKIISSPLARAALSYISYMAKPLKPCPRGGVTAVSVHLAHQYLVPNQGSEGTRVNLQTATCDSVLKHCPIAPLNIPQQLFNLRTCLYRLPEPGPRLWSAWCMYMRCGSAKNLYRTL